MINLGVGVDSSYFPYADCTPPRTTPSLSLQCPRTAVVADARAKAAIELRAFTLARSDELRTKCLTLGFRWAFVLEHAMGEMLGQQLAVRPF